MVTKKAKVIMLPTENSTHIYTGNDGTIYYSKVSKLRFHDEGYHLYVTSDEEIKEGDWFMNIVQKEIYQNTLKNYTTDKYYLKKIIATTDKSLTIPYLTSYGKQREIKIEDNNILQFKSLPQPSQSFIEKYIEEYNKGGIIIDILVEYRDYYINEKDGSEIHYFGYEFDDAVEDGFIVPKKVKNLIVNRDNTINILPIKDSWNREEVENLLFKCLDDLFAIKNNQCDIDNLNKWKSKNL